jgi:integrase/recombinase XerD
MARRKRRNHPAHVAHLLRQRGKQKIWYGFIDGAEVSLGTSDAIAAQHRLEQLAAERRVAARAPQEAASALLSVVAAKFAEAIQPPRMTKKSAASYQERVVAFVEWCEKRDVRTSDGVDYKLMSAFVHERGTKVKARTINRDVTAIRALFKFAKRQKLIAANPFIHEDFRELKLKEPQPKPNAVTLSPSEVIKALKTADTELCAAHASLFRVLAGSGIRLDEARHLDETDIELDGERGFITIAAKDNWQPKNYRLRRIPVTKTTCDAARRFIATRSTAQMHGKALWLAAKSVYEAAELRKFTPHDLRRAWASALYARGMPLKQVSTLLGHCAVSVTERYIRVFETESTGHEYLPL